MRSYSGTTLDEPAEQRIDAFGGYASPGVGYFEPKLPFRFLASQLANCEGYRTFMRELDCVGQQVEHDLPETSAIAAYPSRNLCAEQGAQLDVLRGGLGLHQRKGLPREIVQIERAAIKL